MEDHTPLFVDLNIQDREESYMIFDSPKCWATLAPKSHLIERCYQSPFESSPLPDHDQMDADSCQQALIDWSSAVEKAVCFWEIS